MEKQAEPVVFISHKHTDRAIAEVVASFIRSEAPTPIRVYFSSHPGFEGPKFGKNINSELRTALWQTDVLILIYTTAEDQDWSWCMWECGVALGRANPERNLIVFQCGSETPKVFNTTRLVNVRKTEELQAFLKQYFTDTDFFPSLGRALWPHLSKEDTDRKAADLHDRLKHVLPEFSPAREWPTWPYLKVQLSMAQVDRIRDGSAPPSMQEQVNIVKEAATVATADTRALEIFGLANLDPNARFSELSKVWLASFPSRRAEWFDSSCEQIVLAASEKLLKVRPVAVQHTASDTGFLPIVARVRRVPQRSIVEFEIHFLNVPPQGGEFVSSRMLTPDQFYWKGLDPGKLNETKLLQLSEELRIEGKNRLPLLDGQMRAKYIVHRSKIDEFIVARLANAPALSLADLLADPGMSKMFKDTFVIVGPRTTMDQARFAMQRIADCRDIFVTNTGSPEDPVVGWLTNVDVDGDVKA